MIVCMHVYVCVRGKWLHIYVYSLGSEGVNEKKTNYKVCIFNSARGEYIKKLIFKIILKVVRPLVLELGLTVCCHWQWITILGQI